MLKVGGIFVSPYEVENCLLQHPVVAECAVIGYKDRDGLIKPKAYVVPRDRPGDDALARELQDFVKTRLAPFKYPRVVEFALSLPKNDRGKIDRRRLAPPASIPETREPERSEGVFLQWPWLTTS